MPYSASLALLQSSVGVGFVVGILPATLCSMTHTDERTIMLDRDRLLFWLLVCLCVAVFASIQPDPCTELIDGTEAFLRCELGVD